MNSVVSLYMRNEQKPLYIQTVLLSGRRVYLCGLHGFTKEASHVHVSWNIWEGYGNGEGAWGDGDREGKGGGGGGKRWGWETGGGEAEIARGQRVVG